MKKIGKWLTLNIIKIMDLSDYYSVINYAICVIIENISVFGIALIAVALCFGEIKSAIVFAISFSTLRPFAGGIHMNTYCKCMAVTVSMFIGSIWITKHIFPCILWIVAIIVSREIWLLSPVIAHNKKLTLMQQQKNHWITHRLLIVYWMVIGVLGDTEVAALIQIALIMIGIFQMLGISQCNKQDKYKHFPKQMRIVYTWEASAIILSICLFVCQNTVQSASLQWNYQHDIPPDIQRKFDNM